MSWYLNPALTRFREAVNQRYPQRDKTSDGTIGDAAHQATDSDHNPDADGSVDAWDMDVEVNGIGKPYVVDVEHLKTVFQNHPASAYWIHDGIIASRSTSWKRYPYYGFNRHDKHVHWNSREAYENSTAPWNIGGTLTVKQLYDLLLALLTADTPLERQTRDMITGGVQSPVGKGLLTGVMDAISRIQLNVAQVDVELIRRVVREEIDKTTLRAVP